MGMERRRNNRVSLSADALLTVLNPDQTFSPNSVRAVATDLSTTGVKIKSYQLVKTDYHSLIKGVSYAKVLVALPYVDGELDLRGRVVWVECRDKTKAEPAHLNLGITFEQMPETIRHRLEYVIDRLSADSMDAIPIDRKKL